MKKIYLLSLVFVLFFSSLNLSAEDKMSYRDHKLFGAGISLGYLGSTFTGTRSMSIPPLSAYYEMGVHDYITAGPYLGFARWSYRWTGDFRYSWTYINAGARGSFHLTGFLNEIFSLEMDEEKIDWYVTLFAGMEFRRYSSTSDWTDGTSYSNTSRFFIGPSTGVRYYISDNMAIFAEGGYSAFGAFTFGVSFKL